MLQVVNPRITCLPFLQGQALASQPKLEWWLDKLEATQFGRFSELIAEIKVDVGTRRRSQSQDHMKFSQSFPAKQQPLFWSGLLACLRFRFLRRERLPELSRRARVQR